MASGYTNSHSRDEGDFYFETRFYWSSSYDPSTNTSKVTFYPQIYTTVNMGNDLRMFDSKDNNGGVYRDGSLIYAFPTNYSSGNYLKTYSNPYEDWCGLYEAGDDFPTLTVTHNNSGVASIKMGLRGGVLSMYSGQGAYSSWIDDGYYINLSESRSLHVTYYSNGGSGAPDDTYFYGSTESVVLSSTKPSRTGYTFLGWSTSSSATSATYSAGQNIGARSSNLVLYAVWQKKTFTLSISAGTGSTITVKKGSTTLSNGATITYGDELTITFSASTGYNLGTHTVNGSTFTSGGKHTVTAAVSVVSTATLKTFTLSISAGTGSTITVKKGNTTLSNGATVTYGDELTITFSASTGYNLGTHTVNGSTFTSGGKHTVTAAVSVVSTATLKTFTLTILEDANSTIAVKRGSTTLSNGATITYGDELTITFSAVTGYNLSTHTVNGVTFTSGGKHTVTAAVSVASTATRKTFTLSISAGTGSTITVKKGSTTLSNGATITYGDELTITFSASTGYNLGTHTVNGSAFTSGGKHTVTAAVSVVSTATLKTFTLSISAGKGSSITAIRTGSPKGGASTGMLLNGSILYYDDVIEITVAAAVGYLLREVILNGGELSSPVVVKADIRIEATAIPAGVNIADGREDIPYQFAIDTGSVYEIFIPYLDNGQSWELY